jgi:hypothetical protein
MLVTPAVASLCIIKCVSTGQLSFNARRYKSIFDQSKCNFISFNILFIDELVRASLELARCALRD